MGELSFVLESCIEFKICYIDFIKQEVILKLEDLSLHNTKGLLQNEK